MSIFFWGGSPVPSTQSGATWALSALVTLYAAFGFWRHGVARVTAIGIFNISTSLFVGYAGIVASNARDLPTTQGSVQTVVLCWLIVLVILNCASAATEDATPPITMPDSSARRITVVGWGALTSLALVYQGGAPSAGYALVDGAAFTACVLVAAGLLFRTDTRVISARTLLIVATFAGYALYFHQGTGRLRLVALGCCLLVLVTHRFPSRRWKLAALAALPAAVWWLARERLSLQEQIAAGSSAGRTGLESMTEPLVVLAQLFEHTADGGNIAWGRTFFTLPASLFPRDWLPGIEPLGYELVRIVNPARAGTGYSVASTAVGEWVYNFGPLGIAMAAVGLTVGLGWLDRRLNSVAGRVVTGRNLVAFIVWVLIVGAVADLAWSGTHTMGARTLARLPLLGIAWVALGNGRRREAATTIGLPTARGARRTQTASADQSALDRPRVNR